MNNISLTSRIDLNSSLLRVRMTQLGDQISTGRKGNSYAALGTDAPRAMDLRAEIGRRETYQNVIDQALSKVAVTQNVLDRLGAIADKFAAGAAKLMGAVKSEEVQIQVGQAKAALAEVASLLNERYNSEYLFGGSNTREPPIPDPEGIENSGMVAGIIGKIASLNGANAATVLSDTKALAQSDDLATTPFSAFLSTAPGKDEARRSLLGNDNERIEYGIVANKNAAVLSAGETTGSWARDLIRGLASIAGLTPEKAQLGESYSTVITTVQQGFKSAVNALALERGALGVTESRMMNVKGLHASVTTTLTLQVSGLEEVDMATTITAFQATQSQLEASYRAMALTQQLSLTRYL